MLLGCRWMGSASSLGAHQRFCPWPAAPIHLLLNPLASELQPILHQPAVDHNATTCQRTEVTSGPGPAPGGLTQLVATSCTAGGQSAPAPRPGPSLQEQGSMDCQVRWTRAPRGARGSERAAPRPVGDFHTPAYPTPPPTYRAAPTVNAIRNAMPHALPASMVTPGRGRCGQHNDSIDIPHHCHITCRSNLKGCHSIGSTALGSLVSDRQGASPNGRRQRRSASSRRCSTLRPAQKLSVEATRVGRPADDTRRGGGRSVVSGSASGGRTRGAGWHTRNRGGRCGGGWWGVCDDDNADRVSKRLPAPPSSQSFCGGVREQELQQTTLQHVGG